MALIAANSRNWRTQPARRCHPFRLAHVGIVFLRPAGAIHLAGHILADAEA